MPSSDLFESLINLLKGLLGQGDSQDDRSGSVDETNQPGGTPSPITRRVFLLIFDPQIPFQNNRRLSEVMRWNDPDRLVAELAADLQEVSHGYARYEVTQRLLVNDFPIKRDGFRYTAEEYLRCWGQGGGFHEPDAVDYHRLLTDYHLLDHIESGACDEIWTVSFPYAGFYESRMAGPGAFFCNAPSLENTGAASCRFVIMGFNYERGVGEMLESFGHRAESILNQVFRRVPPANNHWSRFTRHQKTNPGQAEVGTVHFAPNSRKDYDWGNPAPVETRCRNWEKYPDLSDPAWVLDCREWGSGDIRAHHKWWFRLMPHISGAIAGISTNWWEYIADPDKVR